LRGVSDGLRKQLLALQFELGAIVEMFADACGQGHGTKMGLKTGANFTLKLESIFDPLDVFGGIEQYCIETAGRDARQSGEVVLGGQDQALLLARINAGCRTAEVATAALPNLGEDQGFTVAKNKVNFTKAAAVIGLNQRQAVSLQILCSELLGLGAGLH
jgi:hypothetical protein